MLLRKPGQPRAVRVVIRRMRNPSAVSSISKPLTALALSLACSVIFANIAWAHKFSDYEQALLDMDMSRLDSARDRLIGYLRENPNDADAHADLGRTYMNLNRLRDCITECTRAVELNPKVFRAYADRAYASFSLGMYENGFADSDKVVEHYMVNPHDWSLYPCLKNRLVAYARTGKRVDTTEDRRRVMIYEKLDEAGKLREQGRLQEAIDAIDRLLKEDPLSADLWFKRGIVSNNQRKHWQAVADFTRALRFSPDATVIYYFRGDCYQQLGMHGQAVEDFTRVIKDNPRIVALRFVCETGRLRDQLLREDVVPVLVSDVRFLRAESLLRLGKPAEALRDLDAVLAFDGDDTRARSMRAETVLSLGRFKDAIKDYTQAIKDNRSDWKRRQERADAYLKIGRNKEAVDDFTEIVRQNRADPGAYQLRAAAYQAIGEYKAACDDLTTVISLKPDNDDSYISRAECLRRLGKFDDALADLKKARELNPANAGLAGEKLAQLFADRGEEEKARNEMLVLEKRLEASRPSYKALPLVLIGAGAALAFASLVVLVGRRRGWFSAGNKP